MPLILLGVVVVIAIYIGATYNKFVTIKTRIGASIQEIGNQLKRQASLIPNLEESARAYLKHEKGIFKELAEARKAVESAVEKGDLASANAAGEKISSLIPSIRAVLESNPEIKGVGVITKMMDELRDTADKLMYARRTVIDLSADYNVSRRTFPSNIVANMFSFGEEKGLVLPESATQPSVSEEDMKDVKVKFD